MDLSALIASVPGIGPYIPWITAVVTLCAVLCPMLQAPASKTGAYYVIYQIINTIALNFGHAKNLSAPESAGIVGGPGAIANPQVAVTVRPLGLPTPSKGGTP